MQETRREKHEQMARNGRPWPTGLPQRLQDCSGREATGAAGPQDMGKVMGVLKPKLAGKADMTAVSAQVKAALAK